MTTFRITQKQLGIIKDHPVHYELAITWDAKEGCYIFECASTAAKIVKQLIDD